MNANLPKQRLRRTFSRSRMPRVRRRSHFTANELLSFVKGLRPEDLGKSFFDALAKYREVIFDWNNNSLSVSSEEKEKPICSISTPDFVAKTESPIFTKLDLVLFLKRSGLKVTVMNHSMTEWKMNDLLTKLDELADLK